jgi:5-methylcytosine-specific restriction endonuclease McrA
MPTDRSKVGDAPEFIKCDPISRYFPPDWKDVWFRRMASRDADGVVRYECPLCSRRFDHREINYLQGDHLWPYSLFGDTSWANYQLICGSCNAAKSNVLETEIRLALGSGEFRLIVYEFLSGRVEAGKLARLIPSSS